LSILAIEPFKYPFTASVEVPGSKSYTNRALILAALTEGAVTLQNPLYSDDTEAMIACLRHLGLRIDTAVDQIVVHDDISVAQDKPYELFAQDSGTTLRFLLALLCIVPGTKILKGTPGLNERPIRDLVDALRLLGAGIEYLGKEGQPPLKITSSTLSGGEVSIDPSTSSQFLSALLMIAPRLQGLLIRFKGKLISKPYVDMTVQMMREWDVDVSWNGTEECCIPSGRYRKDSYRIEGDFSSAAYFWAIAALNSATITVNNLNPHSLQADFKFLKILGEQGHEIIKSPQGLGLKGHRVEPIQFIDMEDCPDQVQTMAVLAAFANGPTTISGVRSLRVKETERVKALKNELAKMGIPTEDTHNTLTVHGGNPQPATIETYGDHRMAMAFAVASTRLSGMKIQDPHVVNKTFPTFWDKLRLLSQ